MFKIEATYILLDAAMLEQEIEKAKDLNQTYLSLYKGVYDEALLTVAPYIFTYSNDDDFAQWYILQQWGSACGVLLNSNFTVEAIYKHFRKFLLVKTDNGEELYFRFYDPRVLRIFLPTCDIAQLKEFFGPVEYFICEDEDPDFGLVFSLAYDGLKTKRVTKEEIFDLGNNKPARRKFFV